MDDIHAFSSYGSAEQAVRALAKTAELYSQVLEPYRLLVNWKPRKTEALLPLRGNGASVAAEHLTRVEGVMYLPLEGIQKHGLRIVTHLKHSGVISAKSSSMHQEATRRAGAGTAVHMPLARTVRHRQVHQASAGEISYL